MREVALVTDDDLARSRVDPQFRHRLVADNLELLLKQLNGLGCGTAEALRAKHIRVGVDLASLGFGSCVEQGTGPQQAADVVGPERGSRLERHQFSYSYRNAGSRKILLLLAAQHAGHARASSANGWLVR